MFVILLFRVIQASSLLQEIELANEELKHGKVNEAEKIFKKLYNKHQKKPVLIISYTNFLYKQGKYEEIKNLYKNYESKLTSKMKEFYEKSIRNIKMEQRMAENLEFLYKESPFRKDFIVKMAIKYMKNYDYVNARSILVQNKDNYSDSSLQIEYVHLLFLEGKFKEAFSALPKEYEDLQIFKDFKVLCEKSKKVESLIIENGCGSDEDYYKQRKQSENKFRAYKSLIDEIKDTMHKDSFTPSILTALRDNLIETFLFIGKSLAIKGLSRYAKDLIKSKSNDDNKFYYVNCLIQENNLEQAKSEIEFLKFKNNLLKEKLENLLRKEIEKKEQSEKEEEMNKKKQRENEKRRREQQQNQWEYQQKQKNQRYGKKGGDDPKGYYKILGVDKNASENEIRKKYKKLIIKKDPDAYKGKDEKKKEALNEELMKINEAKSVLLDKKKRDLYDQGLYDQQNQGANYRHAGGHDVNDIFKAFFGGGGGSQFFTSGNNGRYEQRTYFYL